MSTMMNNSTNRFHANEVHPNDVQLIENMQVIDPEFTIAYKLHDIGANRRYVYQLELPNGSRCHVGFTNKEVLRHLPPFLHEHIDKEQPQRLRFDIEHEFNAKEIEDLIEERKTSLLWDGEQYLPTERIVENIFYDKAVEMERQLSANIRAIIGGKMGKCGDKRKKLKPIAYQGTVLHAHRMPSPGYAWRIGNDTTMAVPKFSCHIIFTDIWVENAREARHIAKRVAKDMAWVDMQIYKTCFFRVAGCAKRSEPGRRLSTYGGRDVHWNTSYNCQRIELIVPRTVLLPFKKRKKPVVKLATEESAKYVFEDNAEALRGYTSAGRHGNIIRLNSGDTPCLICARSHKSRAQNYIALRKDGHYFCCSDADNREKRKIRLAKRTIIEPFDANKVPKVLEDIDVVLNGDIEINTRYIGDYLAAEYAKRMNPMLFVSSPMGTGKTVALRRVIEVVGQQSVLMLSFRKAFTREKAADLGLRSYQEFDGCAYIPEDEKRLIVQFEALGWLHSNYVPQLLIIDESEAILEQMNKKEGDNPADAIKQFKRIIGAAGSIIVMDANLSWATVKYMRRTRQDMDSAIIHNSYRHTGQIAKVYWHETQVETAFVAHIKNGGQACFCSDSKSKIESLAKRLELAGIPLAEIFAATGETREDLEFQIGGGNITEVVKKYRAFLYNTTLLAGISIEDVAKTTLFASFNKRYITPSMACQLIGRVREVQTLHLFARDIKLVPKSRRRHSTILMRRLLCDNYQDVWEGKPPRLIQLLAAHSAHRDIGQARLRECLLALLWRHGYQIDNVAVAERDMSLFGAEREAKAQEAARILAGANEYARDKKRSAMYECRIDMRYSDHITQDDLAVLLDKNTPKMLENLLFACEIDGQTQKCRGLAALDTANKLAWADEIARANCEETELAAQIGKSLRDESTIAALIFCRSVGCDLSGNIPTVGPISGSVWREKVDAFLRLRSVGTVGQARATAKNTTKIINDVVACLGISFSATGKAIDGQTGKRLADGYTIRVNPHIELVGGFWQLKMLRRMSLAIDGHVANNIE